MAIYTPRDATDEEIGRAAFAILKCYINCDNAAYFEDALLNGTAWHSPEIKVSRRDPNGYTEVTLPNNYITLSYGSIRVFLGSLYAYLAPEEWEC